MVRFTHPTELCADEDADPPEDETRPPAGRPAS